LFFIASATTTAAAPGITFGGPITAPYNPCDFLACGTGTGGINGFHQATDQNGVAWDVGDFPGEITCQPGGVFCAAWNALTQTWEPTAGDVADNNANALANAISKTGVQALANPCTTVAWLGASAVAGGVGAGIANPEAVGKWAVHSAAPWLMQQGINAIWKGLPPGEGIVALGMFYGKLAVKLGKSACNAME
jgi:hypothetical protein